MGQWHSTSYLLCVSPVFDPSTVKKQRRQKQRQKQNGKTTYEKVENKQEMANLKSIALSQEKDIQHTPNKHP